MGLAPVPLVPIAAATPRMRNAPHAHCSSCDRATPLYLGRCSICGWSSVPGRLEQAGVAARRAASRMVEEQGRFWLRWGAVAAAMALVLAFLLPVAPGLSSWDVLWDSGTSPLALAVLSPLLAGVGVFGVSAGLRSIRAKGIAAVGLAVLPVVAVLVLARRGGGGLPLSSGTVAICLLLLGLPAAALVAGSYLAIFHPGQRLPRVLAACGAAPLLLAAQVSLVTGSPMAGLALSLSSLGPDLAVALILGLAGVLVAIVNLIESKIWNRDLGLLSTVTVLGAWGYVSLRLLVTVGLADRLDGLFGPALRLFLTVPGVFLLFTIGVAWLLESHLVRTDDAPAGALPGPLPLGLQAA